MLIDAENMKSTLNGLREIAEDWFDKGHDDMAAYSLSEHNQAVRDSTGVDAHWETFE